MGSRLHSDGMPVFSRKQRVLLAVVPPMVALLIRMLGATWRVRDVQAAGVPVGHTVPGPTVFAFWHEGLLSCAYRFRGLGIAILISRSFDGELIARTVERLGFVAVRGSSSRGGAWACGAWCKRMARGGSVRSRQMGPRDRGGWRRRARCSWRSWWERVGWGVSMPSRSGRGGCGRGTGLRFRSRFRWCGLGGRRMRCRSWGRCRGAWRGRPVGRGGPPSPLIRGILGRKSFECSAYAEGTCAKYCKQRLCLQNL